MITYKVIIEIKEERAQEWFKWMSLKHIPDVVNTGHFVDFSFGRLIPNGTVATKGYIKYQIQYLCRDINEFHEYEEKFAPALKKEHEEKFQGAFIPHREIYEDVTEEMIEEIKNEDLVTN